MRAAAKEVGAAIYIGCQVLHFDASYDGNTANRKWNQGVFQEAGDSPDFYVMHNYYGNSSTLFKYQVDNARTEIIKNINFIRNDIKNKNAASRPVAITEWNCNGPDAAKISIANGAQAVVLFSEMIKNNFGMSCRWPIANWETDGLLYRGNDTSIPAWSPRPDFFYIYYLEKFTGNHVINTSSSNAGDVLAYATTFSSGEEAIVVVNKGVTNEVVQILPKDYGFGNKYYVYTLVGGDNLNFSQSVSVNGVGAGDTTWGPIKNLPNIKAFAYSSADGVIKFESPYRSVEYIMLEPGNNTVVSVGSNNNTPIISDFYLDQNYPNPFNPATTISYRLPNPAEVTLKVFNSLGKEVAVLLNKKFETAGVHQFSFDASFAGIYLPSGIYFYTLSAGGFSSTKKMILLK